MWPWWLGCADEPTREPPGSEATHDTAGHTGHAVTASLEVEVTGGATGLRDLRCRARLVDGEAPVILRWSVDGAPGPEGDHVRADRTQPGQRWRCDAEATVEGVVLTAADEHVVPTPPGENVLVIVLDDVGTDRFSAYGTSPTPAHTPRLDALADSAVRFETVYAAPACSTTRSRALTGRYNMRFGLMSSLREEDTFTFPDGELTLAELARLATVPRRTAAFGKWHLVTRESLTPRLRRAAGLRPVPRHRGEPRLLPALEGGGLRRRRTLADALPDDAGGGRPPRVRGHHAGAVVRVGRVPRRPRALRRARRRARAAAAPRGLLDPRRRGRRHAGGRRHRARADPRHARPRGARAHHGVRVVRQRDGARGGRAAPRRRPREDDGVRRWGAGAAVGVRPRRRGRGRLLRARRRGGRVPDRRGPPRRAARG
jgi:hypothetical protein